MKLFLTSILLLLLLLLASCNENQVYIVYFGEHSGERALDEIEEAHHSYLLSVKESKEDAKGSLLYSYKHSINGFAAVLTPDEASQFSEMEEVVSVFRSYPRKYSVHTTRSWKFSGLVEEEERRVRNTRSGSDLLSRAKYGKGIVVGLLDSGKTFHHCESFHCVWPESESFRDKGMGPVPKSWKGICQTGPAFGSSHCNRKLIGARYYIKGYEKFYGHLNNTEDYRSPRDKDGHGTHTASTVGGRRVKNVSALGGFARGTASGGAPLVRLAIYKVCWPIPGQTKAGGNTCFEEDMLAALDDAIADGVNVLSISIGTAKPVNYMNDGIAVGALHAIKKDIVVACSAGNSGPGPSTLSNPAPWVITVAASSVDREFPAPLILGNGHKIKGQTVTPSKLENKIYSIVYAAEVIKPNVTKDMAGQCLPGSLSEIKTKGKIVLCMRGSGTRVGKGMEVKRAGGAGFILGNGPANGAEISCDAHVLPATAVVYEDAIKIMKYINSTNKPTASILPAKTMLHTKPAPSMAAFSSRGPNAIDPFILKPDITAPGLNILAAWSPANPPTRLSGQDHRVVRYNIFSGTSMSCPHVAASIALLKAIHPTWSSAAIRSALMTTAGIRNNIGLPLSDETGAISMPFAYGSGHFRPSKAVDPGLVYDTSYSDYLLYLCSLGIKTIDPKFTCPRKSISSLNLNYPSIAIPNLKGSIMITRTLTNVGSQQSIYFFSARPPKGSIIRSSPSILLFDKFGEKKTFTITVSVISGMLSKADENKYCFGWYKWNDGLHNVRSSIAVSFVR